MDLLRKIKDWGSLKSKNRQRYKKYRDNQECVYCRAPSEGKYACSICRESRNNYYKNYKREWRKNHK